MCPVTTNTGLPKIGQVDSKFLQPITDVSWTIFAAGNGTVLPIPVFIEPRTEFSKMNLKNLYCA